MRWVDDIPWADIDVDEAIGAAGMRIEPIVGAHEKCRPLLRLLRLLGHDVRAFWYGAPDAGRWVKLDLAGRRLVLSEDAPAPYELDAVNIRLETQGLVDARDATVSFSIDVPFANATFGGDDIRAVDAYVTDALAQHTQLLVDAVRRARPADAADTLQPRAQTGLVWLFDPKNWLPDGEAAAPVLAEHWQGVASVADAIRSLHLASADDDVVRTFFDEQIGRKRKRRGFLGLGTRPNVSYCLDARSIEGHNFFDAILKVQELRGEATVVESDRSVFRAYAYADIVHELKERRVIKPSALSQPFACLTDCRSFGTFVTRTLEDETLEAAAQWSAIASAFRWFVREGPVLATPAQRLLGASHALAQEWICGHEVTGTVLQYLFPALCGALLDEAEPLLAPAPEAAPACPVPPPASAPLAAFLDPCAPSTVTPPPPPAEEYARPDMATGAGGLGAYATSWMSSLSAVLGSSAQGAANDFVQAIEASVHAATESQSFDAFAAIVDTWGVDSALADVRALLGRMGTAAWAAPPVRNFRYQVAFTKGLCAGLCRSAIDEKNLGLVGSAVQLNICGLALTPVSSAAFLAGAVYQIFCDIRDLICAIIKLCQNADVILAKITDIGHRLWTALTAFIDAAFEVTSEQAASAFETAWSLLTSLHESLEGSDFTSTFEDVGLYLGEMLFTAPLNFVLGEARAFDLLNKGVLENFATLWWYFFGWGKFLGPLVIEIVVTAVTGVGLVELLGKNSVKLVARLAPKVVELVQEFVKATISMVGKAATELADEVMKFLPELLGYLKKLDVPADAKVALEWLGTLFSPADVIELVLSLLAAFFAPPTANVPEESALP